MSGGGILTGYAIEHAVADGDIVIDPYDPGQLNPASYDLRLGDDVAVYDAWVLSADELDSPADGKNLVAYDNHVLDVKKEPTVTRFIIGRNGWVLQPRIGYLMRTLESVYTSKYVSVIDGKSSLGRLFVQAHSTAGYIDPGFRGNVTLEVTVEHPIRIYAGMRFAQLRYHTMEGATMLYQGNYTGEAATGAVASRAWRQFR